MGETKKKILFIINPISGGHNKAKILKTIPKILDNRKFDISFVHTKRIDEAKKISKMAVEKNIDIIVAVGGDGTINEIASQLVNTNTALAIIPCGSGNGLARDLGISLQYKKAIKLINSMITKKIDVGCCNNQYFFSLAGVGFDAKVAYDFNRGLKRQLLGYVWYILKDYFNTKEQYFEIDMENEKIIGDFFFITIANCSQWGYNVRVAPNAELDDGILTVNFGKKPSFFSLIPFGFKMLSGKINTSKYSMLKNVTKILIKSNKNFFYHTDGDAKDVTQIIEVDILHKALTIISK